MDSKMVPDEIILRLCAQILPDFHEIRQELEQFDPEMSRHAFAVTLMEFGRGRMSGVDEPEEKDIVFMNNYIDSLNFDNAGAAFFSAYSGGCLMGLASINKLRPEDFSNALQVSENFALKEFRR